MIHQWARVLEVSENLAWVVPDSENSCALCTARHGCGAQFLAGFLRRRSEHLWVVNGIGAKAGDRVEIAVARSALLRGAFAVYMLPLLGMFAAGFGAEALVPIGEEWRELWVLTLAMSGLGVSLWLVGKRFRDTGICSPLQPIVLKNSYRPDTESANTIYSGENR